MFKLVNISQVTGGGSSPLLLTPSPVPSHCERPGLKSMAPVQPLSLTVSQLGEKILFTNEMIVRRLVTQNTFGYYLHCLQLKCVCFYLVTNIYI